MVWLKELPLLPLWLRNDDCCGATAAVVAVAAAGVDDGFSTPAVVFDFDNYSCFVMRHLINKQLFFSTSIFHFLAPFLLLFFIQWHILFRCYVASGFCVQVYASFI